MREEKEIRSLGYAAFEKEHSLSGKKTFERMRKAFKEKHQPTLLSMNDIVEKYDVTNISPAQMVLLAKELYTSRLISEIEFAYLSFQPELHPNYNATIGKNTGKVAQPDKPRNYIEVWENQVHEDLRRDSLNIAKSWRIMKIMHHLHELKQTQNNAMKAQISA